MMEATGLIRTFDAAQIIWYPSPDLCLDTILSRRSTDNSLDFMAWFVLWFVLSTVGPWCMPFHLGPIYHSFNLSTGYGMMTDGTTTYINASACTVNFQPMNPPIVFDLPNPRTTWLEKARPQNHTSGDSRWTKMRGSGQDFSTVYISKWPRTHNVCGVSVSVCVAVLAHVQYWGMDMANANTTLASILFYFPCAIIFTPCSP